MLDVRSFHSSGQAEFHTSAAAGLKTGQLNHQETVPFWCRILHLAFLTPLAQT
jgi:hypothetical protein